MKVTLINTSDAGGGAPEACRRLLKALENSEIDVRMLVQKKTTAERGVLAIADNFATKLRAWFNFLYERLPFIFFYERDKTVRFAFSTANIGTDISEHRSITDADILHLHWTNRGFLSINNLKQLVNLEKPVVWTLHDMWAFTGGCHYAGTCDHFIKRCGNCYFLNNPGTRDISHDGWADKHALLVDAENVVFVTCSNWLADVARKSDLLHLYRIEAIPNPIDTALFTPKDKTAARQKWHIKPDKKIILFGAANMMDRRKGLPYLIEALDHLKTDYPALNDVEIVVFGKNKSFDFSVLPFKIHQLSTISSTEELTELYSLADVFVSPAIEDNLPNMVMESLSCGTPVVAFNTGGMPDMVLHQKNGYLAEYKSAADLARGINYILSAPEPALLVKQARKKVLDDFSQEIVAAKYIALYQSLLN